MATFSEDRDYYRDFSSDWLERMLIEPDFSDDQRIVIQTVLNERAEVA